MKFSVRMECTADQIKVQLRLNGVSQSGIGLYLGQFQGMLRRFHGFRVPTRLRVSGGQGAQHQRITIAGQLIRLLGQFHRLLAVPQRNLRAGRQQPGQVVEGFSEVGD